MEDKNNNGYAPLSVYEYDAFWMSYRYAIGRHTITCLKHAENIIKNVYYRLSDSEKEFDAFDIRREINMHMSTTINFAVNLTTPQEYFDPVTALVEFSKRDEVKETGLLHYLQKHSVTANITEKGYEFDVLNLESERTKIYPLEVKDLLVWANVANAFDKSKHHIATIEYDGKTEEVEVFERIIAKEENQWDDINLYVEYCDIKSYLEKPYIFSSYRKECIKKLSKV